MIQTAECVDIFLTQRKLICFRKQRYFDIFRYCLGRSRVIDINHRLESYEEIVDLIFMMLLYIIREKYEYEKYCIESSLSLNGIDSTEIEDC